MDCLDCGSELVKEKEKFGICEPCEEVRANEMMENMQIENAAKEESRIYMEEVVAEWGLGRG